MGIHFPLTDWTDVQSHITQFLSVKRYLEKADVTHRRFLDAVERVSYRLYMCGFEAQAFAMLECEIGNYENFFGPSSQIALLCRCLLAKCCIQMRDLVKSESLAREVLLRLEDTKPHPAPTTTEIDGKAMISRESRHELTLDSSTLEMFSMARIRGEAQNILVWINFKKSTMDKAFESGRALVEVLTPFRDSYSALMAGRIHNLSRHDFGDSTKAAIANILYRMDDIPPHIDELAMIILLESAHRREAEFEEIGTNIIDSVESTKGERPVVGKVMVFVAGTYEVNYHLDQVKGRQEKADRRHKQAVQLMDKTIECFRKIFDESNADIQESHRLMDNLRQRGEPMICHSTLHPFSIELWDDVIVPWLATSQLSQSHRSQVKVSYHGLVTGSYGAIMFP